MAFVSMDIGIRLLDYPKSKKYVRVIHPCIVCWDTTKSQGGVFVERNKRSPKRTPLICLILLNALHYLNMLIRAFNLTKNRITRSFICKK